MKILVCMKQVPDKDSTFRIDAEGTWVDTENLSFQVNDYDRYALEEALRIKDGGDAEVVVASVGPDRVGCCASRTMPGQARGRRRSGNRSSRTKPSNFCGRRLPSTAK